MRRLTISAARLRRLRGITLMEAILALAIGGVVITQSIIGINTYTENVRVQATASQLQRFITATDQYAQDNYQTLVANAPEQLPLSEIAPYIGQGTVSSADPFGNTYSLATRTYPVTVPDPANPGSTVTVNALQVLIVGDVPAGGEIASDPLLLVDIANTTGEGAGFRAAQATPGGGTILQNCAGVTVTNSDICGAFGSYIVDSGNFSVGVPATASLFGLVTKGDATFFEDYLYRYDYGDPELNTMRTDIEMAGNNIDNLDRIRGIDGIDFNGPNQEIVTSAGDLSIESAGNIGLFTSGANATSGSLYIRTGDIVLERVYDTAAMPFGPEFYDGVMPEIRSANDSLNLDADIILLGEQRNVSFYDRNHGAGPADYDSLNVGHEDSNLWAGNINALNIRVRELNSLFADEWDPLRLQRSHANSLTIFGIRNRYDPGGGAYEIADGDIVAQHATLQDITCADCGGSLSHILPRWRHMGTYFVSDSGTGVSIPKPACTDNRSISRNIVEPGGNVQNDDSGWSEATSDSRYTEKIILTPRQILTDPTGDEVVDLRFRAVDNGGTWTAFATGGGGSATALAMTYCVFTGGQPDPAGAIPDLSAGQALFTSADVRWNTFPFP